MVASLYPTLNLSATSRYRQWLLFWGVKNKIFHLGLNYCLWVSHGSSVGSSALGRGIASNSSDLYSTWSARNPHFHPHIFFLIHHITPHCWHKPRSWAVAPFHCSVLMHLWSRSHTQMQYVQVFVQSVAGMNSTNSAVTENYSDSQYICYTCLKNP